MSESHAAEHAHHELGFIRKYIFSTDHKIIGIQYMITAMAMAVVGGLLSMLMRYQLAWPTIAFAEDGEDLSDRLCRRHHGARVLHLAGDDARHDHGLLSVHRRADRRFRKLPDPAADRRARHGVPVPERAVLLDIPGLLRRDLFGVVRDDRAHRWEDGRHTRRSALFLLQRRDRAPV